MDNWICEFSEDHTYEGETNQQALRNENYSRRFDPVPIDPSNIAAIQYQSLLFYQTGKLVRVSNTCSHHPKHDPFSRDNRVYSKITVARPLSGLVIMMSLFRFNSVIDLRCSLDNEKDEWSGFKDTAFVERY